MRSASKMPKLYSLPHRERSRALLISIVALMLLSPEALIASNAASTATSQISRGSSDDRLSPPNVLTGPDFRVLMKIMRTNIGSCGVPLTAVLRWRVLPDGVIDDFMLHKSSGSACFDEIVTINAEQVIKAKLRITPATREGVAEAAWVPFAVAARD